MLRLRNLGSGSSGNATLLEAGGSSGCARLLIDCGLGLRELESRLVDAGVHPSQVDALFITHEHADHAGSAVAFVRSHGCAMWLSQGTYAAMGAPDMGDRIRLARDGGTLSFGGLMELHPYTVPHDASEPLQLVCTQGGCRVGILTDIGHPTPHVRRQLAGCHALMLECNHDSDLLAASAYPPFLKQRIGGAYGHLSNLQAAELAASLVHDGLRHLIAAHLSERNNRPSLAQEALAAATGRSAADILVADPTRGTPWLTMETGI
ncbi:MAG: MBL fold metallo-hydrolase [Rhodoferax sp.]|nr:MBL fold metallo-hydrolase [Rhodoferax sp.]